LIDDARRRGSDPFAADNSEISGAIGRINAERLYRLLKRLTNLLLP